jgi:hypothetical protein
MLKTCQPIARIKMFAYSLGNAGHLPQKAQQAQHTIKWPDIDIDIDNVVVVVVVVMMRIVIVGMAVMRVVGVRMAVMVSVVVVMHMAVAVSLVLISGNVVDGAVVGYKLRGRHDRVLMECVKEGSGCATRE